MRLDGSKLFSDGGISINDDLPLSIAGIIPSELGKTIFIWNNDPNLPDSTLAQIYDTLGNKIWDESGIVIAHPAISYQGYTIDRNGGFIISGIINNFTVVAQQVSKYGNFGEIITSITQDYQVIFPSEPIIFQNHPNSFNPTTTIRYQLPKDGMVTLKVYDILGAEVATLVNEEKVAGKYELTFDAGRLASGVYIYRLSVNDYVNVKKMVLLK